MKFLSNIKMNDNGIAEIDLVQFNDNVAEYTPNEREIVWNIEEKTFDVGLGNGVVGQMFQKLFFTVKAVGAISSGDVVVFEGSVGDNILAKRGLNSSDLDGHFIMGVATEDIEDEGFGRITSFGEVKHINTLNFDDAEDQSNSILYMSDSINGGLTNIKPQAPLLKSAVAVVKRWHNETGSVIVRPDFGVRLNGLQDIEIINPNDNDILYYDNSLGIWTNKDFPNITTISSTEPSNPRQGDLWWDDSEGALKIWDANTSEWINTIGSISVDAQNVNYDNTTSQALSTDVQGAIDELFFLLKFANIEVDGENSSSAYEETIDGGTSSSQFENQINGGGS